MEQAATNLTTLRHEFSVRRDRSADITLPGPGSYDRKLVNVELALAPDRLFYVGLYARPATEVRMVINGRGSSAAGTAYNEDTLWTIFWAYRNLPPPPEDDADAPGTPAPVTVRFEVYKDGELRVDVPAMAGVNVAFDPRTTVATCTR